jgi:hypothetical protein
MADNTFLAPLSPIQRSTPSERVASFQKNERSIYNKFSPYDQAGGGIGPDQPFVYTKLTDSNFQKSLTKYDSRAVPIGSVARDLIRMGKFTVTGTGILFLGKQLLLQGSAPFDETRTYNAGSVLGATRYPLFGNRPVRHIESSGGLLNFFASSLLSTIGFSTTKENLVEPIPGTATAPLSPYVQSKKGGRYGLMRGETAASGLANMDKTWLGVETKKGSGGFLASVLKSIASTTGLFSKTGKKADWLYRPEYKTGDSPYISMVADSNGLLSYIGNRALRSAGGKDYGRFYNDSRDPLNYTQLVEKRKKRANTESANIQTDLESLALGIPASESPTMDVPDKGKDLDTNLGAGDVIVSGPVQDPVIRYAGEFQMTERFNKDTKHDFGTIALYKRMFDLVEGQNTENQHPMYNKSAERYNTNTYTSIDASNNYKKIPSDKGATPYYTFFSDKNITLEDKGFAKATTKNNQYGRDNYNNLETVEERNFKRLIYMGQGSDQSQDIIFFYFKDLIHDLYLPFRATLGGISDQNSPEWDPVKYMGRADTLFVYKGFTRDVNFNFRVYANSVSELVSMWKRINYLVGLTRPSKYTDRALATAGEAAESGAETDSTGRESGFIYPPMIEFRIGDLYVDQPAILNSVTTNIPDDANWETLRSDEYVYYYGNSEEKSIKRTATSRQLPTIVDISVGLRLLEKQQSQTSNYHFGPITGWENTL